MSHSFQTILNQFLISSWQDSNLDRSDTSLLVHPSSRHLGPSERYLERLPVIVSKLEVCPTLVARIYDGCEDLGNVGKGWSGRRDLWPNVTKNRRDQLRDEDVRQQQNKQSGKNKIIQGLRLDSQLTPHLSLSLSLSLSLHTHTTHTCTLILFHFLPLSLSHTYNHKHSHATHTCILNPYPISLVLSLPTSNPPTHTFILTFTLSLFFSLLHTHSHTTHTLEPKCIPYLSFSFSFSNYIKHQNTFAGSPSFSFAFASSLYLLLSVCLSFPCSIAQISHSICLILSLIPHIRTNSQTHTHIYGLLPLSHTPRYSILTLHLHLPRTFFVGLNLGHKS